MVSYSHRNQSPISNLSLSLHTAVLPGRATALSGRQTNFLPTAFGWSAFLRIFGHTRGEVIDMSYVSPKIKSKFESMPIDLKNAILAKDIRLENMNDLMTVLEQIVAEDKGRG